MTCRLAAQSFQQGLFQFVIAATATQQRPEFHAVLLAKAQVQRAVDAGAIAVVVVNNAEDEDPFSMGGDGSQKPIPSTTTQPSTTSWITARIAASSPSSATLLPTLSPRTVP